MNAVVTGATGFVGKNLVDELVNQGAFVFAIVRNMNKVPSHWIDSKSVSIINCSMQELSKLDSSDFDNKNIDVFFHFAWAGTSGNDRANVVLQLQNVHSATEAVMLSKRIACKRFLNAGSIMEYEAMDYVRKDNSFPGLGNIYSTAKLTADFMAKITATNQGVEFINIIISNIYGPGEYSARFLNTILRKMITNDDIPLTHGNQLYDFIYISDAVKAIIYVAENGISNSEYYLGNSVPKPLKEFVFEMKRILQSKSDLQFGQIPFQGPILSYKEFDTTKIEKLGFEMHVSFKQGILLTKDGMDLEHEYKF